MRGPGNKNCFFLNLKIIFGFFQSYISCGLSLEDVMDYVEANVGIQPNVEYSPFAKDDSCGTLCFMVRFDETLLKECRFCYNLLKTGDPGDGVDVCPLHLRRYENHFLKESMSLQKFSCT